ncbi:hypothetical protein BH10BAC3_BH10BAC3_18350 [soil metagenome]
MTNIDNQPDLKTISIFRFTLVSIAVFAVTLLHANTDYIPKSIDINQADTTVFIALPGIGSKLATRIVNYREKLHGFYSVEQVGEVFGLADSTFQKIKHWLVINDTVISKININTANSDDLKTPYISYNLANAIYQYRLQHGSFSSLADLKKIMLVSDAVFNKIVPYLTIG